MADAIRNSTISLCVPTQNYPNKHSLAHLQDLIPTLAGVIAYISYTRQSRD